MITWEKFNFQYCPKIIIFNDKDEVLLCERKWEQDFDWIYSFPWWKREITDEKIEIWIKREIQEELWNDIKLKFYRLFNIEEEYVKKIWDIMILPHYFSYYVWWEIELNEGEYSEYRWVSIVDLKQINTIPTVEKIVRAFILFKETDFFKSTFDDNSFSI